MMLGQKNIKHSCEFRTNDIFQEITCSVLTAVSWLWFVNSSKKPLRLGEN